MQEMDGFWKPSETIPMLGGCWSYGTHAGSFCTSISALSNTDLIHLTLPIFAFVNCCNEYPNYIPKRWIHLSKYARKQRTRKKWKHEIQRTIELYKKRNKLKGAQV